jgi:large subunit ribosomal protein L10
MENPRPEKVAVVDEVRSRLAEASGAILTEYRGLTVSEIAELRRALEKAGGEYKVYKNTLVRLATAGTAHESLHSLLVGPTAIAFVNGEISAVAKALRDYARGNPHLVVKGGMFGDAVLSTPELSTLADLPPRDVLLARLAGAIAAPLQQMAGLLQALPRNLAYGLSALIDKLPPEAAPAPEPSAQAETAPEPATPADTAPVETADTSEADTSETAEATAPSEPDEVPTEAEAGPTTEEETAPTTEAEDAPADTAEAAPVETAEAEPAPEAAEQAEAPAAETGEAEAQTEQAEAQAAEAETAEAQATETETAETENDVTSETKEQSDNG